MIRQIVFHIAGVLTISLALGCSGSEHGVKSDGGLKDDDPVKMQASAAGKSAAILKMLESQDASMMTRRQRGSKAILKLAANPDLSGEDRAKLIDALKKCIDVEKDTETLTAEKEALAALEKTP